MLAGRVITGGVVSITVTVKVPFAWLPCVSVAVHVTVVGPIGNVAPETGAQANVAASSGSVALTAYVTTAPLALVATAVMLVGRLRVGAVLSSTTTVALALPVLPAPATAGPVVVVAP